MEEDIKILEEKLRQWEPYKNIKFKTEIELELQKENRALENLIKGYRELERKYDRRINELKGIIDVLAYDSIPKSKIKEQILNPLKEEHDKAITGFMKRDIPYCLEDGGIAQELGCIIGKIEKLLEDK